MELVITFKNSESILSNFTYTMSECRLKLCQRDANPIDNALLEFCESVMNFLAEIQYPISLRSAIKKIGDEFYVQLAQSIHHGKKHEDTVKFIISGVTSKLRIEETNAVQLQEHAH